MRPMADPSAHRSLAYRPELDGIRGLAILAVIAQHINLPNTAFAGMVGVNLFFVLSGFLITSLLMAEHDATGRISLRTFYERRIRRLLPALVALLLAVGVLMALQGRLLDYLGPAAVSLFYVGNVAKAMLFDLGYVGHTWSLALEEQFYLIWPAVIIFAPRRWLVPLVLGGIAVSMTMQAALAGDVMAWFRPDTRADAILWGCLIALLRVQVPRIVALGGAVLLVVVATSWLGAISMSLSSIGSAAVVAGAATLARPLSNRWLVRVGEISYGLYLWHAIPIGLLAAETAAGNVAAMVVAVVASFALALASERWIEKPFRRARRAPAPVSGFASEPQPVATA